MTAVKYNQWRALAKLKSLGADLNQSGSIIGCPLLFLSVQYQSLDCFNYLLKQDLNPYQKVQGSPEYWLKCMKDVQPEVQEKIQALFSARYGADYLAQEVLVITLLDIAELTGNQKIIKAVQGIKKMELSFFNSDSKRNSNQALSESLGNRI
jgi:hypothetical protein